MQISRSFEQDTETRSKTTTIKPGKSISEDEVEKWRDDLTSTSFDRRDKVDGPVRELVGTVNERFIVTKNEINTGIAMVRQFATIAGVPHSYKVAETLAPVFDRSKALYALILSFEYEVQNLVRYSNLKLSKRREDLEEIDDKLTKITRFLDTTREKLSSIRRDLGDFDLPDLYEPEKPKTQAPRKPVRFIRPGERHTKASNFNLANLIKRKKEER